MLGRVTGIGPLHHAGETTQTGLGVGPSGGLDNCVPYKQGLTTVYRTCKDLCQFGCCMAVQPPA